MRLIVGLGNIGSQYEKTNHNAGFMVLDEVAKNLGVKFNNRSCDADWGEYKNEIDKFILAKPRTFMNNSGLSVKSFLQKYKIDIENVLVISDDIDQESGNIRIRKSGSAGTHNGLKSIVFETKSQNFARIRVGIGRQNENQDLAEFVLSKMKMTDSQKLGLENAKEAVLDYINGEGLDHLMTKYNGNASKNGKH